MVMRSAPDASHAPMWGTSSTLPFTIGATIPAMIALTPRLVRAVASNWTLALWIVCNRPLQNARRNAAPQTDTAVPCQRGDVEPAVTAWPQPAGSIVVPS
jgi:hypothetical protein